MTYAVVAPEHPLVDELTTAEHTPPVDDLRRACGRRVRDRADGHRADRGP